ncbi:MAG: hypothetical protein ACRCYY_12855 [Trueperaceae bacterium]
MTEAVKDHRTTGGEAAAPGVRSGTQKSQPSGREAAAAFASLGATCHPKYL